MDTKSKSTNLARGIFSWFCYLLTFFAVIAIAVYSSTLFFGYGSDIFNTAERGITVSFNVISGELRELSVYKESASSFFERLYYNVQADESLMDMRDADGSLHYGSQYLESISRDNLYTVIDYSASPEGVRITNDPNWDPDTIPADFNYLFTCKGGVVEIYYGDEDGYRSLIFSSEEPGAFYTNTLAYTLEALRSDPTAPDIYFAVRTEPTSYHASNEIVSSAKTYANQLLFQLALIGVAALLFLLMLIFGIVFRRDRLMFTDRMAAGMKHIWIEIKLIFFLCGAAAAGLMIFSSGAGELRSGWFLIFGLYT
ncbi:MAG: hypothetical protein J6I98_04585, partial [Clostridia bacterium]|nr:hypothetical protein [Clostridia bacterium]